MRKFCFVLLIFPLVLLGKERICLNMIVKDESPVIRRCLESVKPLIDYWVIVDTGSTDGTQELIRSCMKGIPGELHERKWVNFGHNRNEALLLAQNKGDYCLFIDADEKLVLNEPFKRPQLDKELYFSPVHVEGHSFRRALLIKNGLNWAWKGVIHEELVSDGVRTTAVLEGIEVSALFQDGKRSQDPKKHLKDAQVLEQALEKDPTNSRYVYYLAQEYLGAQEYSLALKNYEKRATMGGFEEEVFLSLYAIARLQDMLNMPSDQIVQSYSKAYQFRPSPEPLFHLATHYFKSQNVLLSLALTKLALSLPTHHDGRYRENEIHDYQLLGLYADSLYLLGRKREAQTAYSQILEQKSLPESLRQNLINRVEE